LLPCLLDFPFVLVCLPILMFWLNKGNAMHTKNLVLQLQTLGFDPITWEEGNSEIDGEITLSELVHIQVPSFGGALTVWKNLGNNNFSMSKPIKNLVFLKRELDDILFN